MDKIIEKHKYECKNDDGIKRCAEKMDRAVKLLVKPETEVVSFKHPDIDNDNASISASSYFSSLDSSDDFIATQPLVLRKAFEIYQGSGYKEINGFLREYKGLERGINKKFKYISVEGDNFHEYEYSNEGVIDALDTLINKVSTKDDMIIYRGCDLRQFTGLDITDEKSLLLATGSKFTEYGYASTTPTLTGRFAEESPVILAIRVPKGTHMLGPLSGEGEILLERNSEFEIKKVEIIDGKYHVYLDMKPNLLEKGKENIEDIHITDNPKALELEKLSEDEYDIDFDYFDEEEFDILEDEEEISKKKVSMRELVINASLSEQNIGIEDVERVDSIEEKENQKDSKEGISLND